MQIPCERLLLALVFAVFSHPATAQNGYVIKADDGSVMVGYLKYFTDIANGQQGIEIWRHKRDKAPVQLAKSEIREYAIKKDTVRVIQNFRPFDNTQTYFDLVEAKIVSRGKVALLVIQNFQNPSRISTYTGGGIVPAIIDASMGNVSYMYVLENESTGYLRALSTKKEALLEGLRDFFPDDYLLKYEVAGEEIKYKGVPGLVKLYNSK
jgi:hypothetical protein